MSTAIETTPASTSWHDRGHWLSCMLGLGLLFHGVPQEWLGPWFPAFFHSLDFWLQGPVLLLVAVHFRVWKCCLFDLDTKQKLQIPSVAVRRYSTAVWTDWHRNTWTSAWAFLKFDLLYVLHISLDFSTLDLMADTLKCWCLLAIFQCRSDSELLREALCHPRTVCTGGWVGPMRHWWKWWIAIDQGQNLAVHRLKQPAKKTHTTITTFCWRSVRNDFIQRSKYPLIPYAFSLWMSLLWGTTSKAMAKSMKTTSTGTFDAVAFEMKSIASSRFVTQALFCTKLLDFFVSGGARLCHALFSPLPCNILKSRISVSSYLDPVCFFFRIMELCAPFSRWLTCAAPHRFVVYYTQRLWHWFCPHLRTIALTPTIPPDLLTSSANSFCLTIIKACKIQDKQFLLFNLFLLIKKCSCKCQVIQILRYMLRCICQTNVLWRVFSNIQPAFQC